MRDGKRVGKTRTKLFSFFKYAGKSVGDSNVSLSRDVASYQTELILVLSRFYTYVLIETFAVISTLIFRLDDRLVDTYIFFLVNNALFLQFLFYPRVRVDAGRGVRVPTTSWNNERTNIINTLKYINRRDISHNVCVQQESAHYCESARYSIWRGFFFCFFLFCFNYLKRKSDHRNWKKKK